MISSDKQVIDVRDVLGGTSLRRAGRGAARKHRQVRLVAGALLPAGSMRPAKRRASSCAYHSQSQLSTRKLAEMLGVGPPLSVVRQLRQYGIAADGTGE